MGVVLGEGIIVTCVSKEYYSLPKTRHPSAWSGCSKHSVWFSHPFTTGYLGLYVAIPTVLLAAAFVAVVYVCRKKKPLPNPTVSISLPTFLYFFGSNKSYGPPRGKRTLCLTCNTIYLNLLPWTTIALNLTEIRFCSN